MHSTTVHQVDYLIGLALPNILVKSRDLLETAMYLLIDMYGNLLQARADRNLDRATPRPARAHGCRIGGDVHARVPEHPILDRISRNLHMWVFRDVIRNLCPEAGGIFGAKAIAERVEKA